MQPSCPPHPNPLPPKRVERGLEEVTGFSNHNILNQFRFFPSPLMGERAGVRGK